MEILNYYINTLSAAGGKLLPVGVFMLVGYFLFIKIPFYFMKKVSQENKALDGIKSDFKKDSEVEFKSPAQPEKLKLESNSNYQERLKQAREEKEKQQKRREQESKQKKKEAPPKAATAHTPAEEVFEMAAGQILNKSELKKRYFELLKQNHPDKVASLGNDFKVLAEKKTKAINSAYEELKKKAS